MREIPNEVIDCFKSLNATYDILLDGCNHFLTHSDLYGDKYVETVTIPTKFICNCKESHGVVQNFEFDREYKQRYAECKFCHKSIYAYSHALVSKHFTDITGIAGAKEIKSKNIYYFRKTSSGDGLECYIGNVTASLNDDNTINRDVKINYFINLIPGKEFKAYKLLKRSDKEVSLFEAFNINSNTRYISNCYFENANNIIDFMDKNMDFMKKTGFYEVLKYGSLSNCNYYGSINPTACFVSYISLVSEYPVIEFLIKMGYTTLVSDVIRIVIDSGSKREINENVRELNKLLNETTKGSLALRIPQYIGEYLKTRGARLSEFLIWCDIYELESISKENFQKLINSSIYFSCLNSGNLGRLPNILKYGYSLNSLLKYLHKQIKSDLYKDYYYQHPYSTYHNAISALQDYLDMCDMMGIASDKEPMDLRKAHDEVSAAYTAEQNKYDDAKYKSVADSVKNYLKVDDEENKILSEFKEKYTLVIPESTYDFVNEGQQQHNCVGWYCQNVLKGYSILFFIRKKDNPDESFITAEYNCRSGRLAQFYYKNNRPITDSELIKYGQSICNKINRGLKSGKIVSLKTEAA